MPPVLSDVEVRVLGCLVEKQVTTPEYYPLTLNLLTSACNQKSNRDPIVEYDDKTVVRALDSLRDKKLAWMITSNAGRVPKYEQSLTAPLSLSAAEVAALCVLMLRGPQTPGEIRGRTERLHAFASIEEVEATLDQLAARADGPLVVKLPRQSGRKEARFAHLLAGEPKTEAVVVPPPPEAARVEVQAENERLAKLEAAVQELRDELAAVRTEVAAFRRQFE